MKTGDMAIHLAAGAGSLEIVRYLIAKSGVGVNVRGQVSGYSYVSVKCCHMPFQNY